MTTAPIFSNPLKDLVIHQFGCCATDLTVKETFEAGPRMKTLTALASKIAILTKISKSSDQLEEYQRALGSKQHKKLIQEVARVGTHSSTC